MTPFMIRRLSTTAMVLVACTSVLRAGEARKPAAPAFARPEGSFAFDLGAKEGEAASGFEAVPFDRTFHDGFGFVNAIDNTVDRRDDTGYPTLLEGTGVLAQDGRTYTFACRLPDGRYVATAYMGGMPKSNIANFNHILVVNGKRVISDERSINDLVDQEFFRHVEATLVTSADLKEPGRRVYDLYIRPIWKRHDFQLNATGGRLDVTIESGQLNALVITPAAKEAEHRAAMAKLDAQREREFVAHWATLIPNKSYQGSYPPSEADKKRGYVVFRRHWMRKVEHDCRPDPEWVGTTLSAVATPGEYEPVTFSLWPLADLPKVSVTVGEGKGEGGLILPVDTVRVWYLQQRQERSSEVPGTYRLMSMYLPDWGPGRDLFKDMMQQCWLSIHVPAGAKPGLYTFPVRVKPDGGQPADLALSLRVLPFTLERPERMHSMRAAGTWGTNRVMQLRATLPIEENDIHNALYYRKQAFDHLVENGLLPELNLRGGPAIDWDRGTESLSHLLAAMKASAVGKQGLLWVEPGMVSQFLGAFSEKPDRWTLDDLDAYFIDLSRKLKEAGFHKVYVQVTSEESHLPGSVEQCRNLFRYLRAHHDRWPNLFLSSSCNTEWGELLFSQEADLACLGMFHGVCGLPGSEQVAIPNAAGKPFIFYGCPGRIMPGFYLWKAKGYGSYHESYNKYECTPDNDWDNPPTDMGGGVFKVRHETNGFCNAVHSPKRMISSWYLEEFREGVDDDAYLATLEHWIERTAKDTRPAVAAARQGAQAALEEVADAVDLDVRFTGNVTVGGALYRPFAEEDFDALRWKVAREIVALKDAAEGATSESGVPEAPRAGAPLVRRVAWGSVEAQPDEPLAEGWIRPAVATPLEGGFTVDGKLDEPCYKTPPGDLPVRPFHLVGLGAAPYRTETRLFAKGDMLYIGMRCEDEAGWLRAHVGPSGGDPEQNDNVQVFLDSDHNHTSYYHFIVSLAGARKLVEYPRAPSPPGSPGRPVTPRTIEPVWDAAAKAGKGEWTVEIAVRVRALGVQGLCFGMNLLRCSPARRLRLGWAQFADRQGGVHQPRSFTDVYFPGYPVVLMRVDQEPSTLGKHTLGLFFRSKGKPSGQPVVATLISPDGHEERLTTPGGSDAAPPGQSRFNVQYTLDKPGLYTIGVQCGATNLGRYPIDVEPNYLEMLHGPERIVAGRDDALSVDLRLLPLPPDLRSGQLALTIRLLSSDLTKVFKEGATPQLRGNSFRLVLNVADLLPGHYTIELLLQDAQRKILTRLQRPLEVIPQGL